MIYAGGFLLRAEGHRDNCFSSRKRDWKLKEIERLKRRKRHKIKGIDGDVRTSDFSISKTEKSETLEICTSLFFTDNVDLYSLWIFKRIIRLILKRGKYYDKI